MEDERRRRREKVRKRKKIRKWKMRGEEGGRKLGREIKEGAMDGRIEGGDGRGELEMEENKVE